MSFDILQDHLHDLLNHFEKKGYLAERCEEGTMECEIMKRCESLLKLDYSVIELNNIKGILCQHYPSRILIPEYETRNGGINNFTGLNSISSQRHQSTIYEDLNDSEKLRESIYMAKHARCRERFPVPVILYRGKYICRSATVSLMTETYGRKAIELARDYVMNGTEATTEEDSKYDSGRYDSLFKYQNNEKSAFEYNEILKNDVQLLKQLKVGTIVDLMVENKKVKYLMYVSSSEKADPHNHYSDFSILTIPYPGCEFFKKFRDNNYEGRGLVFDWSQKFIDVKCHIPNNPITSQLKINWKDYTKWDLVLITQNYLKVILKYIQDDNSGLLIHCISGWDRTPLFISLVRLSLWADGLIHQSLSPLQMTYYTVAYDWYLFGHQLPNRITKGEDILFFCFHFLKYMVDDEFRVVATRNRNKTLNSGSSIVVVNEMENEDERHAASCHSSGSSIVVISESESDEGRNHNAAHADIIDENSSDSSVCGIPYIENIASMNTNCSPSRSPHQKRTSPISVPHAATRPRQRHESTSSNDSWQMVTDAGSVESNCLLNAAINSYQFRTLTQNESNTTSFIESSKLSTNNNSMRAQKLHAVRAIFVQAYGRTAGLRFKEGSHKPLANFVGSLADQFI